MSGHVFACFRDIVRQIPPGKVATYGQIARLAGMPRCARTVGRFGGTKAVFDICAPGTQRALLEAEGVAFRPDGTVDLERCRWES